ncbi:hypothetical protein ACFLSQ_10855 [Bacteroidota bacterium]
MTYTALIDEIQNLPHEDKIELKDLIDKYLIDERRSQFLENYKEVMIAANKGDLEFTSDIDEMKHILDESL